jgi:indoleamine 2,3-dioxygenase
MQMEFANGFLPDTDPLKQLPAACSAWEDVACHLPKYLLSDGFRQHIARLPTFPLAAVESAAQCERAMLIISFIGHGFMWGSDAPVNQLPRVLAEAWVAVAARVKRPPILSYASYALHNWQRFDPDRPIALGNIGLLQNFLGGIDEEWFVLVHVDIEARAATAIRILAATQQAAIDKNTDKVNKNLHTIATTLQGICTTLDRMPEHCDPYIYYQRVRPYIHGWKNNPALPQGLIYEGVYDNVAQFLRGETGAQSTIIPALDAVLGITHAKDELASYLAEMRDYMPPAHRAFLTLLEKNQTVVRAFVQASDNPALREVYNICIDLMTRFRLTHLRYAAEYIHKQSEASVMNSTSVGTGGTPFMRYLKKHEEETAGFKL